MNIKTIARAYKKIGLFLIVAHDTEFNEDVFILRDMSGNEIIKSNDEKHLYSILPDVRSWISEDITQ